MNEPSRKGGVVLSTVLFAPRRFSPVSPVRRDADRCTAAKGDESAELAGWHADLISLGFSLSPHGEVVGEAADLTCLPRHLHLLLGVAIVLELVDVGNDIEGEGVGEDLWGGDGDGLGLL